MFPAINITGAAVDVDLVKIGRVLYTSEHLNVVCVNANGLRTRRKRELLGKLLFDLQAGVGVITETHLRRHDLDRLHFRNYNKPSHYCRPTEEGRRIGGGVLLLVHNRFNTDKLPRLEGLDPLVEHCSCILYPTDSLVTAIRISGVYIPPSGVGDLDLRLLRRLSAPCENPAVSDAFPHLLAGDFNNTGWEAGYTEWTQEEGIIELLNPTVPTFAMGTSIDKFLFIPGFYFPSTFLPVGDPAESGGEGGDGGGVPYFPASVVCYPHFSDHSPIVVSIPCEVETVVYKGVKRIRVDSLTEEDWVERDKDLGARLEARMPASALDQPLVNLSRFFQQMVGAIRETFHAERRTPGPVRDTDPFEHFLLMHVRHPEMDALLAAIERGDEERCERYMCRMGADGWRSYLKSVNKSDTRAFFAYLARSEGRKQQGFVPADSAPMRSENGELVLTGPEKVGLLTRALRRRFSAPAMLNPLLPRDDPNNVALPPYRKRMTGICEPIRAVEVKKALLSMAGGKSPGPDGLPVEIFQKITSLSPYLLKLLDAVYRTGHLPLEMRAIHIVPLVKPGKDPSDPNSSRPISLLNSITKILECIMYNRILPLVEPKLYCHQYAYRRLRGTEHHLVSLMDFAHRALIEGNYVYIVSYDIAGAFDRVSHYQLVEVLPEFGIDTFTERLLYNWLSGRTFTVKYRSPGGTFFGERTAVSSGLPQGGVLSPLLWLMFFNEVHAHLHRMREERGVDTAAFLDAMYADDLTTVVVAPTTGQLRQRAWDNDEDTTEALGVRALQIQGEKTHNILLNPNVLAGGTYRRAPPVSALATKTRRARMYAQAARFSDVQLELDPFDHPALQRPELIDAYGFPYPLAESMRVLGVQLDEYMTLDEHLQSILSRAQVRQGILAKVAHSSWGLETSVLRVTYDALLTSLLRYGLTMVGSCLTDDLVAKIDVHIINVASRRVTGLPIFTRIETLHFVAGTQSYRNMYLRQCAQFIHAVLVSYGSGIQHRLIRELCVIYGVSTLTPTVSPLKIPSEEEEQTSTVSVPSGLVSRIKWMANRYEQRPTLRGVAAVGGIYFPHAPELRRTVRGYNEFYEFRETHSWIDVGLQVLSHIGWRPECSQAQSGNVLRALPPDQEDMELILDKPYGPEERYGRTGVMRRLLDQVWVVTGVARVDEVYVTVTVLTAEGRERFCSGYVHGRGNTAETPVYMQEAAVLHGIRVLREWLQTVDQNTLQHINIRAGDDLVRHRIKDWLTTGRCTLQSPAASGLVADLQKMSEWLHTKVSITPFRQPEATDNDDGEMGDLVMNRHQATFMRMVEHFRSVIMPSQGPDWRETLPMVPVSKEELRDRLREGQERTEFQVLSRLAALGSASADIIVHRLQLTREALREAMHLLSDNRAAQVNLAEIISAVRFKVLTGRGVFRTKCPHQLCFHRDSFQHMVECYGLTPWVAQGARVVPFLVRMAKTTLLARGHKTIPYPEEATAESWARDN